MADDPYKYFRIEARELCEQIGSGVLELERAFDPELIARLLRLSHTLKGAARVVKQGDIAREAHTLEEALLGKRAAQASASVEEVRSLLALVDRVSRLVNALSDAGESERRVQSVAPQAAEAQRDPASRPIESAQMLRVDPQQVEELVRSTSNASQCMAALEQELGGFQRIASLASELAEACSPRFERAASGAALGRLRSLVSELGASVERLQRGTLGAAAEAAAELDAVREAAHQLRLLSASTVFPALERAVYDAAAELGKRAVIETFGGDIRLEGQVLTALRDCLLHVVRNAVAHGIETPSERLLAGKPERGVVRIEVRRTGSRVIFRCSDDGRGIDLRAVKRAVVERGLVPEGEAQTLSESQVMRLLLQSRISTSDSVSEIAGRGIGLDAVSEIVRGLRGAIRLDSVSGQGATVELDVPLSVAAISALLVEVNGATVAIPLDAVEATARIKAQELVRTDRSESILFDEELLPYAPAQRALKFHSTAVKQANVLALVLLRSARGRAAISVDRVLTTGKVVLRALPRSVCAAPVVAGGALDAAGNALIVLDADALVDFVTHAPLAEPATELRAPAPVLVIDDSLTTRMLEQSILESAGYVVELAQSAEEGLEKARSKTYGVYIVDVEMPGMNGFEFVAATRADPALSQTPAILVSSRDGSEDKARAARVGARAYIVKGEFEQEHLLSTIRSLMS